MKALKQETICVLLMTIALVCANPLVGQEALDETGEWRVTGSGTIERAQPPPPVEGETALRCSVDERERGYVYFSLAPPTPDLTQFGKLRFRLFGGLQGSSVHEIVIHDTNRKFSKWKAKSLETRSQEPRWTEVEVFFDSPWQDKGTDMRSVKSITWRIHVKGGDEGTRCFFLDGVALEPLAAPPAPAPDQVVLEHEGYQAVFSKQSHFELECLRTPEGKTIPINTAVRMMPLATVPPDAEAITIGGEFEWKNIDSSPERLCVEYERGDYAYKSTFAWEGDALAVRRRVTCRRAGMGSAWSKLHLVSFDSPLDCFMYDRGLKESEGSLPLAEDIWLPGNWFATFEKDAFGAAVVFPRRVSYLYIARDRQVCVQDRGHLWGHELSPGMHLDHELWIVPLKPGSPATQCRSATRAICSRLAQNDNPAIAYFMPQYLSQDIERHTLVSKNGFVLWQTSTAVAVLPEARPPGRRSSGIRLGLARGETEPIHLVISAGRPMKNVSVSCSPLKAGDQTIAAGQVRVRYAGYVNVRSTTKAERAEVPDPNLARFVGEIQNGSEYLRTDRLYGGSACALGPIEDPLFDAPSVNIEPGRNQPVWITLAVPQDAQSGHYQGHIQVSEDGHELCRVPLDVTVWAFTLPRVTSLRTWYQLWRFPAVQEAWREYYRDLAEHKVSGFGSMPASPPVQLVDGKVVVDWSDFDEAATYLLNELGMRHVKLPHGKRGGGHVKVYDFVGLKENTPEFERAFFDYLCQARKHLADRGWLAGMDCYIFDEPDRERIEVIRRTAPIIRRAIPEIRIFPACARNTRSLIGVLNAWCPPMSYFGMPTGDFSPERVAEGRKRGEVYWWYNQSDNCIGAPVITHRALPWATWKAGVDGYFVWSINYWGSGAFLWATRYDIGEAMAIYPGKNGPVDSLRWEQTREGLEDYDYLAMLEKALDKGDMPSELSQRGRAALARARRIFPEPRCLIAVNPAELLAVRLEIGQILDQLAREGHLNNGDDKNKQTQ